MTTTATPVQERTPAQERRRTSSDDYADVLDMFACLEFIDPDSHEYAHQREQIVVRCLPLADHIARHFRQRGQPVDDLTQVARVGLIHAVNRFNPEKGRDFIAFAVPTMMGEVRRHFRDHSWSMHVPRRIGDMHVQISRATEDLVHVLNRAPTARELAEAMGADHDEVVECLVASHAYQVDSLDAPLGDDVRPQAVGDRLGRTDPDLDLVNDREAVRPLLMALAPRDREVLQMRFFAGMTQSQIAEQIGVSQMQVSRILSRTLMTLRGQLNTA